jgi:hypothetical protein
MTMIGAVLALMMNTAPSSVLPLSWSSPFEITEKENLKFKSDRRTLCEKGAKLKHDPERIIKDARLSLTERQTLEALYWTGQDCLQDKAKAIALLDAIVGYDPTADVSIDDINRLIEYHRQYSPEKSSSRIIGLNRMLWMRGQRFQNDQDDLGWDQTGMKAFVLSDPIWSWFESNPDLRILSSRYQVISLKIQALLDPASPRFDFEKGIASAIQHRSFGHIHTAALALEEGKIVLYDPVRAATLLWLNRTWVDTHALLVKRVKPLLDDPDTAVRAKALTDMQELASLYTPTTEAAKAALVSVYAKQLASSLPEEVERAEELLFKIVSKESQSVKTALISHIANQLKSKNAQRLNTGRASMMRFFRQVDNTIKPLLDEDIKRTGGYIELKNNKGLFFTMTDADYPVGAIRIEDEGTVSTTVEIGPDGRVLFATAWGASPLLSAQVAKATHRRLLLKGYEGRYVRAKLPDVHFRLCYSNRPKPPPGTLVVTSPCD